MKTQTKFIALGIIMLMLLSIIHVPLMASTEAKILIIKQDESTYLIYSKYVLDKQFEFAFSNEVNEEDLDYISSIKDSQGNNIAYVDGNLNNSFFNGKTSTYIWMKVNNKVVLKGEKVNLNLAKTESQLESIKNITNKITVTSYADVEKIKVNGDTTKKYYYQMNSVNSSDTYKAMVEIMEEISNFTEMTDIYSKLELYGELYDIYTQIAPSAKDKNWLLAENLEIDKPYDAKENQKYILWLKDEDGNIDIQILTAYQEKVTEKEKKEVTVEVKSKLPVTYDTSTTLYIALAVVIVAIIAMLIVRKKVSNREKKD